MPELPEVNTVQKIFDARSTGLRIEDVEVHDDHIIRNMTGDEFTAALTGQTVTGSYRRGKYLFASFNSGHYVQLHLGMTGDLIYYEDEVEVPKHEQFNWKFNNGMHIGFKDPRKFGRIVYVENLTKYLDELGLGPDALDISEEQFLSATKNRNTTVKSFLLNQKILAGVGNLYADEICYQTRIHPASVVSAVPVRKWKEVFTRLKSILNWACDNDAYYGIYPDNWFWKWRSEGTSNPLGKGTVTSARIAGRTTYFVEGWQKLYMGKR